MTTTPLPGWIRRRPQFRDQSQDLGEQHPWHGDLGHLEGGVAAVADQPGSSALLVKAPPVVG